MRILKFILLKVVEVSVIIFVPYGVGKMPILKKIYFCNDNIFLSWMNGFSAIFGVLFILFIPFVMLSEIVPYFIKLNWEWAGKKWRKK